MFSESPDYGSQEVRPRNHQTIDAPLNAGERLATFLCEPVKVRAKRRRRGEPRGVPQPPKQGLAVDATRHAGSVTGERAEPGPHLSGGGHGRIAKRSEDAVQGQLFVRGGLTEKVQPKQIEAAEEPEHLLVGRVALERRLQPRSEGRDSLPLLGRSETGNAEAQHEIGGVRTQPRPLADGADLAVLIVIDLIGGDADPHARGIPGRVVESRPAPLHDLKKIGVGRAGAEGEGALDLQSEHGRTLRAFGRDHDVVQGLADRASLEGDPNDCSGAGPRGAPLR